jgi:hypothetical protein
VCLILSVGVESLSTHVCERDKVNDTARERERESDGERERGRERESESNRHKECM